MNAELLYCLSQALKACSTPMVQGRHKELYCAALWIAFFSSAWFRDRVGTVVFWRITLGDGSKQGGKYGCFVYCMAENCAALQS